MRSRSLAILVCVAATGLLAPAAHAAPKPDPAPAATPSGTAKPSEPGAKPGKPGAKPERPLFVKPKPYVRISGFVAPKPAVGFADQKPTMFADERFKALGTRNARLNVPWDVLQEPSTLANVDAWMLGARLRGIKPLVTIDRSRRPRMQSVNPTPGMLATQVRKWRLRWPGQIKQISSWNEGNINKRPELVAQWYLAIRKACPGCTVLGVDLVDRKNAVSWAQRFIKAAKRVPAVWGLHNYVDSNTFSTANTRKFLREIPGRVWLTETGGVLQRARPAVRFSGTGPAHAARATSFVLKKIAPLDPIRIERVYLYSWSTAPNDVSWDSGMIGPDGAERPALQLVRCFLGRCNAKAATPATPVLPSDDAPQQVPASP